MARPDFLELPPRSTKPRAAGLTHALDKGLPLSELPGYLVAAAPHIDLWKLGWGTSYLEPDPRAKVEILARHDIRACVGGTLLEAAWAQGKAKDLLGWAEDHGFPCVEVSNGVVPMPVHEKRTLIAEAADRFVVLSEVGSKDPGVPVSGKGWAEEMAGDIEAGAAWVLAEGRESGTVGLYEPDGAVRRDLVASVAEAVGLARVVFEAPRKDQQAWFIRRFGADVNLGNVPLGEVLGLEALRLGLRADTIDLSSGAADGDLGPRRPGPA
jgi:phosphosulfolactate synthase